MYHETDHGRDCINCRWCDRGRECRFFDTFRERVEIPGTALKCPFFDARGPYARMATLCDAIYRVADAIEALQAREAET